MNSPPPITSRANRRRALSLDNPATPLLGTIARRKSDKREQDEAAQRIHRMHVVSGCQCWSMYAVVALLSLAVVGIVFYARRPNAFTPALPGLSPGQTLPGQRTHHPTPCHCTILARGRELPMRFSDLSADLPSPTLSLSVSCMDAPRRFFWPCWFSL